MRQSKSDQRDGDNNQRGGLFEYVSPSRLNLWLKCPRAFELRYIAGIRSPSTPSMFLGRRVHAALEHYYRYRMLGLGVSSDEVRTRMRDLWTQAADTEDVAFRSPGECDKLASTADRLVEAYIAQLPLTEPAPIGVETVLEIPLVHPLTGVDLGISLRGIVDLVIGSLDTAVICDFKTAASSQAPLEICHEVQLGCYAILFRALSGRKEKGLQIRSLVKTKTPRIVTSSFPARTKQQILRLFEVIEAYLNDIRGCNFLYRPDWSCRACEFRLGCA